MANAMNEFHIKLLWFRLGEPCYSHTSAPLNIPSTRLLKSSLVRKGDLKILPRKIIPVKKLYKLQSVSVIIISYIYVEKEFKR